MTSETEESMAALSGQRCCSGSAITRCRLRPLSGDLLKTECLLSRDDCLRHAQATGCALGKLDYLGV